MYAVQYQTSGNLATSVRRYFDKLLSSKEGEMIGSTNDTHRGEPVSVCVNQIAFFEHRPNTMQFWISFDLHKKKYMNFFSKTV